MARYVTSAHRETRQRWKSFLEPLVGDGRPIGAKALATAISGGRAEPRSGDATWQVYDWLEGERTVSPDLAFEAGEALRTCGIAWSTGFGALWSAGYLGGYARAILSLAQAFPPRLPNWPPDWPPRDVAVVVGTQTPLYAGVNLERPSADAEWLDRERRGFGWFIGTLPAGWSCEAVRRKNRSALDCDNLLSHAATLGDDHKVPIEIRERHVWMQVVEWAIEAASPVLRDGRLTALASLWADLPRRLIVRERDAAVARARDQRTADKLRREKA